jgi:hypothetical protein
MSPRAAWRLEGLGFERVYDYVPGKADWFASGLPKEGRLASAPTLGDAARREVPNYAPVEKIGVVRERVRKMGWDRCVVVNKERVVLGLLREKELSSDPISIVAIRSALGEISRFALLRLLKPEERPAPNLATSVYDLTTPAGQIWLL